MAHTRVVQRLLGKKSTQLHIAQRQAWQLQQSLGGLIQPAQPHPDMHLHSGRAKLGNTRRDHLQRMCIQLQHQLLHCRAQHLCLRRVQQSLHARHKIVLLQRRNRYPHNQHLPSMLRQPLQAQRDGLQIVIARHSQSHYRWQKQRPTQHTAIVLAQLQRGFVPYIGADQRGTGKSLNRNLQLPWCLQGLAQQLLPAALARDHRARVACLLGIFHIAMACTFSLHHSLIQAR